MMKPLDPANLFRRLCALALIMTILFSAIPSALGSVDPEPCLSLYFANATMEEGKSCGYTEQFFSNIAAISMNDLRDQNFLSHIASAVDSGYKYRVFVLHEKGMPATDLVILFCFQDSSWLLKDTTAANQSVYPDASWEIREGVDLKQKQQELISRMVPDCDNSYECDAKYVWQIYMEFVLFIEERNKAFEQMLAGSVDNIPELPEEIDSWPLDLPISVQLPKELSVVKAFFTVEPMDSAAERPEDIPESERLDAAVGEYNTVTGTLRFWEAGPHLVRLIFTASINGHNQGLSHNINIDTSNVHISCPMHEDGHHWEYEWADEHPHYGRFVCDCGAVREDPDGATRVMPGCSECIKDHEHDYSIVVSTRFRYEVVPEDPEKHQITHGETKYRCAVCGDIKTDSIPITDPEIRKSIITGNEIEDHVFRNGRCTLCGYTSDDAPKEAGYYAHLISLIDSGENLMDDGVKAFLRTYYRNGHVPEDTIQEMISVLEKASLEEASEKYLKLYLLSVLNYGLDADTDDAAGHYYFFYNNNITNTITLTQDNVKEMDRFFHESGHAIELNLMSPVIDYHKFQQNDVLQYVDESQDVFAEKIYYALRNDVKEKILATIESIDPSCTDDEKEIIAAAFMSLEENEEIRFFNISITKNNQKKNLT